MPALRLLALCACFTLVPVASSAQAASSPADVSCVLQGTVRGGDGGIVPGAALTVKTEGGGESRTSTSGPDGSYRIDALPCGEYVLSVTMAGFQPAARGGSMLPGEPQQQDVVLKIAETNTTISVVATEKEIMQAEVHLQEQQRMVGFVPNFFVSYQWAALPLPPRQKFNLALHSAADPANILIAAAIAGGQQAANSLPGYGQGAAGYGRRFGGNMGNLVTGTFLGGAILPTIFHQDPRYFYRGTGSTRSRLWYAVSRAFVTRGDNGRQQVNYSGMLGDLGTGALSNLYVDKADRNGAGLTISNGLLAIVGDMVNNTIQEFVLRKFTTSTRGRHGKASDLATPSQPHP